MGDSLLMFFCSISAIICEESGCSERRLPPDGLSVSQPASSRVAAIAADASSGRINGRRFNPKTPPTKAFPGPLWLNRNPDGVLTARSQTPSDPFEHAIGERKVNTVYSPPKCHFGRTPPLPEEGKRSPL